LHCPKHEVVVVVVEREAPQSFWKEFCQVHRRGAEKEIEILRRILSEKEIELLWTIS
jgi:hypothetical protein